MSKSFVCEILQLLGSRRSQEIGGSRNRPSGWNETHERLFPQIVSPMKNYTWEIGNQTYNHFFFKYLNCFSVMWSVAYPCMSRILHLRRSPPRLHLSSLVVSSMWKNDNLESYTFVYSSISICSPTCHIKMQCGCASFDTSHVLLQNTLGKRCNRTSFVVKVSVPCNLFLIFFMNV